MDDSTLIRHIRNGRSDSYICEHFMSQWTNHGHFYLYADRPGAETYTTYDSKEQVLEELDGLGFAMNFCHTESGPWGEVDIYAGEHNGFVGTEPNLPAEQGSTADAESTPEGINRRFFLELAMPHAGKRGDMMTIRLFAVSPDKRFWELDWYERRPGETHVAQQVSDFMRDWHHKQELLREFREHVAKLRSKYTEGVGPTGELLRELLKKSDFEYNVRHEDDCSYLRVRMQHGRYLEIKLLHHMDIKRIANIYDMISSVSKAIDAVGELDVSVINYGSNIRWQIARGSA